jgi:hypothetical protein
MRHRPWADLVTAHGFFNFKAVEKFHGLFLISRRNV